MPLRQYLYTRRGTQTGIAFVDATALGVCHNRRIHSHTVFRNVARHGKTSTGWFDGFKLHLVVNDRGERLAFRITPGNTDDRQPPSAGFFILSPDRFRKTGYLLLLRAKRFAFATARR